MLDPLPGERSQLFISLPKTSSVLVDMASKTGSSHNNRNCCKQINLHLGLVCSLQPHRETAHISQTTFLNVIRAYLGLRRSQSSSVLDSDPNPSSYFTLFGRPHRCRSDSRLNMS